VKSFSLTFTESVLAVVTLGVIALVTADGLSVLCAFVLMLVVKLTLTEDRLMVVPATMTFHWVQTSLGVFYKSVVGRDVAAINSSRYEPMVFVALASCLSIAVGIYAGLRLVPPPDAQEDRPTFAVPPGILVGAYVATVGFEGTLVAIAPDYPSLRQIIVTFDTARLGLLYLLLRWALHAERWGAFVVIIGTEITLGITGFFAGFREPIVLAVLAMVEVLDLRERKNWLALAAAGVAGTTLGFIWMGIRADYRRDYVELDSFQQSRSARAERVQNLTTNLLQNEPSFFGDTADRLVDRMWTIYYPALALDRVPGLVAHTDGQILMAALVHIVTPRILFPNKPDLPSDSDEVRKYSGVMVAGREQGTSIAFGYAAESYIDFGIPWMFVPMIIYGLAMGYIYALFRKLIWHRDLFVAFVTVTFWVSLYLFERSWATMLGVSLGFVVYLGIPVVLLDRLLLVRHFAQKTAQEA
jgi:hypothetical protein